MARPPPAETTACVDRQITGHLTGAGANGISVALTTGRHCRLACAPLSKRLRAKRFSLTFDAVSLARQKKMGSKGQQGVTFSAIRNGAHAESVKGEPGEVPRTLLRFYEHRGSARCGGRAELAPAPHHLLKRWTKLLDALRAKKTPLGASFFTIYSPRARQSRGNRGRVSCGRRRGRRCR